MDTLSAEQFTSIGNYWERRESLNREIYNIQNFIEIKCIYNNDDDYAKIIQEIQELNKEIEDIEDKIRELDADYEEMLRGFGISLFDRNMDEDLFAFINDGMREEEEY